MVLRAANQVLFKVLALESSGAVSSLFFSPLLYISIAVLMIRAYTWQRALLHYPLSVAFQFTSLTLVLILISGSLLFHEPVTLENAIGTAFIISGLIVMTRSQENATC